MSDTKSSEPVRPFSLGAARRGLTIGGVVLVAVNLVVMLTGGVGGASASLASALLWGGAAACFLGAFVVFMLEPVHRREAVPAHGPPAARAAGTRGDALSPGPSHAAAAPSGSSASNPRNAPSVPDAREEEPKPPSSEPTPLLRRGNPLRWKRGGGTALVGSFLAYLMMAHPGQLRWGVPIGAAFVAVASWGVMDLLGTFDDGDSRVASSRGLREIVPELAGFVASSVLFCAALGVAHAGRVLPQWGWGLVVTATFLAGVVTLFRLGRALGAWGPREGVRAVGADVPIYERYGFWIVVIGACLYFPLMGSYSLWDPWETHYGEVSREILAKDDWISLWWAQDGWFWSKPVGDMWMQAIAMATLGVHYRPDKMLIGDGTQPVYHPEWAVRAPVVLLTILALYILYKGVEKTFGKRPAFLGAVVLATMPHWFFIAHQTMTDMPFVGAMTACMGLVLIGLRTPETDEVRAYEVRVGKARLRLSAWHLVFGAVLLCALPQILYLVSRNIEVLWRPGARGFRPHWDEFWSGSGGGNCGLPGNEDCKLTTPASVPRSVGANPDGFLNGLWRTVGGFEPALQAVLWMVVLGVLLYMNWGERRTRRLYYLGGWFFAAISTLGKGPAGALLPMLVTFVYLCASRPHDGFVERVLRVIRELTQFEIIGGLLLLIPLVALPWYVAMYVRHGSQFTDRLIIHDMYSRALGHVHDTNEGDDTSLRFYIWQLGYGLFPWTGLAPVGLMWWLRQGTTGQDDDRADTSMLLFVWFLFAFALFSFMGTKFHHYILPAVPPVAMLIGVVLDDMLGGKPLAMGSRILSRTLPKVGQGWLLAGYALGMIGGVALMTYGISRTQPGSFLGTKPDGHLPNALPFLGVALAVVGMALVVAVSWLLGQGFDPEGPAKDSPDERAGAIRVPTSSEARGGAVLLERAHSSRMLAAGAVGSALLLVLVARDLILKPENSDQPGAIRLLHLFTYNYRRAWPEALDFAAPLTGFGVVAAVLSIGLAVKAVRRHAVAAICAFGLFWGVWGLDVYMQKTAQHWGQHEVMAAYYADRASPNEMLVAYQMNWKGENFYTGNHIPAFVSTGATFTSWMKKKREEGVKVMYFVTEHGRLGGLKSEVGARSYREVTDKTLCNKFVLVRAEL